MVPAAGAAEDQRAWDGQARDGNQPQVVFEIGRDGKVSGLEVEKSSGNPLYDQAALRAVTEATPFPPLPDDFKEAVPPGPPRLQLLRNARVMT